MTNHPNNYIKEKMTVTYLLMGVFLLIVFDVALDFKDGIPTKEVLYSLGVEGLILFLILITTNFIWKRFKSEIHAKEMFKQELQATQQLATQWEKKSKQYVAEFHSFVSIKFDLWNLSKSEKDIAILLLKGKSSKDIANVRHTSERTIRNQCQAIYEKSQLLGKSEFAAFFMRELIEGLNS